MGIFTGVLLLDVLGIITALAAVTYAYFKWSFQFWRRKNVPYLEPSIPFGNFVNPLTAKESFYELSRRLYGEARAKGYKQCGIYEITRPNYLLVDLELTKYIMTKDFDHFVDRGEYVNQKDDPIGAHLFSLGGKKWKNLRAKLTPTFSSGKLKMMFQTLAECGVVLEQYILENIVDREAVDIKDMFARFTTDIIGSCAFGLECNSFKEQDSPFKLYAEKFFCLGPLKFLKLMIAGNFPHLSRKLGICTVDKDVAEFFTKVVEDAVAYREKNNVQRKDILQLLIDLKNNDAQEDGNEEDGRTLSMNEVIAQCFLFFAAGYETSSTTATFVLYELARHQEIQDKVREEITEVLEKHGNQISYDSLNELTYMKQVIDESLRMYPPGSAVARECVEDYKVPGYDLILEKGMRVFIPIAGFHYDKEYYENPTEFNPDRFSEENKKKIPPYAYIPFGTGPRVCIGERFAFMELKVGLTAILRKFRVTLNEKTHVPLKCSPKYFITTAEGGVWLNFHKV